MIRPILLFFMMTTATFAQKKVDLIVHNANIYTVNKHFSNAEALAVTNGKIIAVGKSSKILKKYTSTQKIDANGKTIVPGLIDAHCHFYGFGLNLQEVDLSGTNSFDEVVQRIVDFQKVKNVAFITGRGWDQNDWEVKEFPTKEKLDLLFPNTPAPNR